MGRAGSGRTREQRNAELLALLEGLRADAITARRDGDAVEVEAREFLSGAVGTVLETLMGGGRLGRRDALLKRLRAASHALMPFGDDGSERQGKLRAFKAVIWEFEGAMAVYRRRSNGLDAEDDADDLIHRFETVGLIAGERRREPFVAYATTIREALERELCSEIGRARIARLSGKARSRDRARSAEEWRALFGVAKACGLGGVERKEGAGLTSFKRNFSDVEI